MSRAEAICVCDFGDQLGLAQPSVSHHVRTANRPGLIACGKRGTYSHYRLAKGALEAVCPLLTAPPVQLAA